MTTNKIKIFVDDRDDFFVPYCVYNGVKHTLKVLWFDFDMNDKKSSMDKFNNEYVAVAVETSRGGKIILATND